MHRPQNVIFIENSKFYTFYTKLLKSSPHNWCPSKEIQHTSNIPMIKR